ncbi:TAP42-like protein [Auriculariales sp. MPI-PUGE-AT-0066]|nr:TAP42-like protein [Auriculariales sp. MPI-PUGE-AT-0066]
MRALSARVDSLALFSPNETLEDLTARDMVYLTIPYARSEIEGRVATTDPQDRLAHLRDSQTMLARFTSSLENYGIVTDEDKQLWRASAAADAAKRRENRIKQYKNEKAIRGMIDALRATRGQPAVDPTTEFEDVIALLPSEKAEASDDDDDATRKVTVLVLRLLWSKAQSKLESMKQELEILASMPPSGPSTSAPPPNETDTTWRLDPSITGRSPLLDSNSKPLRPFTILPSGSRTRTEIASDVFRPDHRLPTMTIDEYLAEEQARGNIITGGGPASLEKPTTSEQLQMDSEHDGSIFGEEQSEAKRQKDENWARYTDTHRKGEGNTMNRG